MTKPYVMSKGILRHYLSARSSLMCRKCDRAIEIGEEVVVPHVGKCYHKGCFESCFI